MVDGVVRERVWGAMLATLPDTTGTTLRALPSYDALMDTALYSIGVPHYLAACSIVHNDPQVVARLPMLVHIGEACARAFRLANDLRTWEKEEREQTFNTLMAVRRELQSAQPGLSAAEYQERALHFLQWRLGVHVAQTRALLAASPVPDGAVEVGISRLVEFVTQFYAAHDYHTFRAGSPIV